MLRQTLHRILDLLEDVGAVRAALEKFGANINVLRQGGAGGGGQRGRVRARCAVESSQQSSQCTPETAVEHGPAPQRPAAAASILRSLSSSKPPASSGRRQADLGTHGAAPAPAQPRHRAAHAAHAEPRHADGRPAKAPSCSSGGAAA